MTIFAFIMLFVTFALLLERSYRVVQLKKTIATLESEITAFRNKNEDFAAEMHRANQAHTHNMLKDPVTDLLNKEAFENQLQHLLNQSRRFNTLFAVLLLDLMEFKKINENYSRNVGDKVLCEIGKRLKTTLRDVDIIARYEGDVFAVLLPNMVKPEVIVHAVERIMHAVDLPINVEELTVEQNVSVGVAVYPFDAKDVKTLMLNAKNALLKAKKLGKNVFQFYQEETQALGKRELVLKSAIKNSNFLENVLLEYKPYYHTSKNEISCIEVCAVLNHPELGHVPFSELARVSQYSSKILELYEWMMRSAVEACASYKQPLIFKFDLKQFEAPNFAEQVIAMVDRLAQHKKLIILELVDNPDHTNLEVYREPVSKLNESHIPLAIGVLVLGHFALNKLNHVHFDYLKIDEKLVHDLTQRAESQVILERILSLVDTIKISTLTAGVDTEEQKKLLESMGCSVMQGKIFKDIKIN